MRRVVPLICSALLTGLALPAWSQAPAATDYPMKPIRVIVPFATGGPDTVARLVGARLAVRLNQPFVIENRPAANGLLGTEAVAKAAPDGYTILITSSGFVGAPSLHKQLPYDTERDFAPVVAIAANIGTYLVVHPSVPARTMQEFIAFAKKPEARVAFSSPGLGNTLHLIGELFNERAGVKMLHVPYKGGGPAIAAVISGEV
ncbi:MAG: tripartite tricarboxylate transporter substrate-binding protein, partial [Burkholderiales bacterium]